MRQFLRIHHDAHFVIGVAFVVVYDDGARLHVGPLSLWVHCFFCQFTVIEVEVFGHWWCHAFVQRRFVGRKTPEKVRLQECILGLRRRVISWQWFWCFGLTSSRCTLAVNSAEGADAFSIAFSFKNSTSAPASAPAAAAATAAAPGLHTIAFGISFAFSSARSARPHFTYGQVARVPKLMLKP
eukprot:7801918-Pyramimonas_sp.AAC.2